MRFVYDTFISNRDICIHLRLVNTAGRLIPNRDICIEGVKPKCIAMIICVRRGDCRPTYQIKNDTSNNDNNKSYTDNNNDVDNNII